MKKPQKKKWIKVKQKPLSAIYKFKRAEDLFCFTLKYCGKYKDKSSLYKANNSFYLWLEKKPEHLFYKPNEIKDVWFYEALNEYSTLLSDNAITEICRFIKKD